jgi:hypothetical protein
VRDAAPGGGLVRHGQERGRDARRGEVGADVLVRGVHGGGRGHGGTHRLLLEAAGVEEPEAARRMGKQGGGRVEAEQAVGAHVGQAAREDEARTDRQPDVVDLGTVRAAGGDERVRRGVCDGRLEGRERRRDYDPHVTNARDEAGTLDVAARIRAARARERALSGVPAAVRSPAALRDRLLAALAVVDGIRPAGDRTLAAVSARHPRLGGALRGAAGRALALRDAAGRSRRAGDGSGR